MSENETLCQFVHTRMSGGKCGTICLRIETDHCLETTGHEGYPRCRKVHHTFHRSSRRASKAEDIQKIADALRFCRERLAASAMAREKAAARVKKLEDALFAIAVSAHAYACPSVKARVCDCHVSVAYDALGEEKP